MGDDNDRSASCIHFYLYISNKGQLHLMLFDKGDFFDSGEANIYIGLMSTLYVDTELSCGKIS
jgi:hypothetical protein